MKFKQLAGISLLTILLLQSTGCTIWRYVSQPKHWFKSSEEFWYSGSPANSGRVVDFDDWGQYPNIDDVDDSKPTQSPFEE